MPQHVETQINTVRGEGKPLPESVRAHFEPHFGYDFSRVRIHTNHTAAETARALNANALTLGSDLVFADGHFQPTTSEGRLLIAHELTHIVQQNHQAFSVIQRQETAEQPAGAAQQPPGGAQYDLPDLTALSWQSEDSYVIYILSQHRLFVLPSTGLLFRPVRPRASFAGPTPERWVGVPAVGKEGRLLVRTSGGVGIWLDAGGAPSALLPSSLAALRGIMDLTSVERLFPLHIHADHLRDVIPEIRRSKIQANNFVIAGAWIGGTTGPLMVIVNALRTTTEPDLLALGYGPQWIPAHPIVTPLPRTGLIRIPVRIGNLSMELVGTGESFAAYEQAHRAGRVRAEIADAASLPALLQHSSANYQIFVKEDWRGADILNLRDAMERAHPGSFVAAFSQVRVIEGFQHHMGVVRDNNDVEGIRVLLEATFVRTGELTVVVQTRQGFRNEALMEALYNLGVRVVSAMEPVAGAPPGSAIAGTYSPVISVRGVGVEDRPGQESAVRANQRLSTLRAVLDTVRTNGDLLTYPGSTRQLVQQELEIQVNRLERLGLERVQISLDPLRPAGARMPNLRRLEANTADLNRVEGIEAYLTDADLAVVRQVSEKANDIRALEHELRRMQRTGMASTELYRLVSRLRPDVAEALMFDAQGRPLPRQQVMTSLQRQVSLEELATGRPGAPARMGGRVVTWFLIGIEVINEVAPLVEATQRANLQNNILRFLRVIEWWRERGVIPRLGAAVDPFFAEAQIWTAPEHQANIWDRIYRKVWENIPKERRVPESKLSPEIRGAGGLDALWIEEIENTAWDNFTMWITSHVRNYDEFAIHFRDIRTEAVRWSGRDFPTAQWEVLLGHFETHGWNRLQDNWTPSERLTTIMRATAARVISGTREAIERTSKQRTAAPPAPEAPTIGPAMRTVGAPARSPIETERPSGRAQFKSRAPREMFSDFDPGYRILGPNNWWTDNPTFLVFGHYRAPTGYVLAGGGDYNTYGAIRSAENYQYDFGRVVKIPKPHRELGEAFPRTRGWLSNWPRDEDLNPIERQALHDLLSGLPDVKFEKYPDELSNPYMGEVRYWYQGPNLRSVGLLRSNDLDALEAA